MDTHASVTEPLLKAVNRGARFVGAVLFRRGKAFLLTLGRRTSQLTFVSLDTRPLCVELSVVRDGTEVLTARLLDTDPQKGYQRWTVGGRGWLEVTTANDAGLAAYILRTLELDLSKR